MKNKNARSIGWCEPCWKHFYLSRKEARAIARRHPTHKGVYVCPENENFFHIGELDQRVIRGDRSRAEMYGGVA